MATGKQRQSLSGRTGIGGDCGAKTRYADIPGNNAAESVAGGHGGSGGRGSLPHHTQVLDSTDNQTERHDFYNVAQEKIITYAWLTRSRCPECGTLDTERYASDGRVQYRRCQKCAAHYKQIGEIV
jgi:Zn ribbon nucleic-acid-binding protein